MYHLRFFKLIFAIFINSNCIGQSVLIDINFARDGVNKIYAILESRGSQLPLYKLSDKINVKLPVLNVEIQEIAYTILNSKSLENFFIKGSTRLIVLNFKSENPIILAEDSIPFDFSKSTPLYFKNEELIIDLQSTVSENRIRYCISMSSFPQNIQNNEKLEMSDSIKSRNFFIRNQNKLNFLTQIFFSFNYLI